MAEKVRLLAFDTSSPACSVALLDTAKPAGEQILSLHKIMPMQQGKLILPMINTILSSSFLTLHDLDAIAYGRGPGSFTGIRIASSVAQGLGFATKFRLIPISSLAAIAQTAYLEQQWAYLLVALDARMGGVYWAQYKVNQLGLVELIGREEVSAPETVGMPENTNNWYGVGDGWEKYNLGIQPKATNSKLLPTAQAILSLARVKFEQGEWVKANEAVPVYLR
jgi:tRNA threonylcarbamoyladenosine biosynthesis protein TsaB